jgi:hypothetical protein
MPSYKGNLYLPLRVVNFYFVFIAFIKVTIPIVDLYTIHSLPFNDVLQIQNFLVDSYIF